MGGTDEPLDSQDRSIARHIGALESEELMALASALESLRSDPRFVKLDGLMSIERDRLRRRMEQGPMADVQSYAHANGVIRGLRLPGQVISDVLATAHAVRMALETGEA